MRVAAFLLGLGLVGAPGAAATRVQVPDSLVFVRDGDLFRMTIDGSETVRLTATKAKESSPAVSPDSLRIAFVRGDELWTSDLRGADLQRLAAARPRSVLGASTGSPSWSGDGRTLYFDRWSQPWNAHCASIFRVSVDGRSPERVTGRASMSDASESDPAVSPDGRRVAISSSDECDPGWVGKLAVIDTSGRPTRDLRKYRGLPGADVSPTWSPDGRRITFVSWDFLDLAWSRLYVIDRDGTKLRRITPRTLQVAKPAWSPDGRWIAFSAPKGIYVVRPNGSGLRKVPGTIAEDASPAWLPRS